MAAAERDPIQQAEDTCVIIHRYEAAPQSKMRQQRQEKSTPEGLLVLHFVSNHHQSTQQLS